MTVTEIPRTGWEGVANGASKSFKGFNEATVGTIVGHAMLLEGLDDLGEPRSEWDKLAVVDAFNLTDIPELDGGSAMAVLLGGEKTTQLGTELRSSMILACEANGNAGFSHEESGVLGAVALQHATYRFEDRAILTADRWEALRPNALSVAAARAEAHAA